MAKKNPIPQSDPIYIDTPGIAKNKRAAVIEQQLEILHQQNGFITQKMMVDAARDPDSPLHPFFEWDDSTAAEKYRENQALHMIMATKFVVMLKKNQHQPPQVEHGTIVRKLLPTLNGNGEFRMRNEVLSKADSRKALIAKKMVQLRSWCREASDIAELDDIRKALEDLL